LSPQENVDDEGEWSLPSSSRSELGVDHKLSIAVPEKGIVRSIDYQPGFKVFALVVLVASVYLVFYKELAGLYPSSVVHKVCLVIANWVDSLFPEYLVFCKELAGLYPSSVIANWVDSLFSVYLAFSKELAGLDPSSVVLKVCLVIANWVDSLLHSGK
jgi:hypothetical protein